MAVTKRTRFEVLRRDKHTCQYCGEAAPNVVLNIDHIVPTALGGSDSPENLVTACKDCNSGKTSISPDSPIVAAISLRSAEWAVANANRNAHIDADFLDMEQYREEFLEIWGSFTYKKGIKDVAIPLDSEWKGTLNSWWKTGVPKSLIESAVDTAMGKKGVLADDRFRYFCGVIWRTLEQYDQRYSVQTNTGRVYSPHEMEEHGMQEWSTGYATGRRKGIAEMVQQDILRHFIDKTEMEVGPFGNTTGRVIQLAS